MTELGEATLLIIPRHASVRSRATEFEVERELFRDAPCRTLQLRPGSDSGERCGRILVPTGSAHEHGPFQKWSQWMALALVVAAIGLAAYETLPGTARNVPTAIKDHLQKTSRYRFVAMQIDRRAHPPCLRIVVEGPSAAVPNLVKEIAIIARRNGLNDEFRVEIETHIITNSDDS